MTYRILSFYRYVALKNPTQVIEQFREKCQELFILGRILIGTEGLNAAVCGREENIALFKDFLETFEEFKDLTFREQTDTRQVYHKLVIREREEIVAFGEEVDLENTGYHMPPAELKQLYEKKEDFVIIDARNDYEFDVGHFKDAVRLPIAAFREFPEQLKDLEQYKEKKVVLYCTGGIRCEKASAYLVEKGFKDVNQLKGGIINYATQFPDQEYKGSCVVFDDRRVSQLSSEHIASCKRCNTACDEYINCHNLDCDDFFVCCKACAQQYKHTCSDTCLAAPRQRQEEAYKDPVGVVVNYYKKAGIALVKLLQPLCAKEALVFKGKTTPEFSQAIKELRAEDGTPITKAQAGELITLPVTQLVRKNDGVYV